MPDIKNVTVLGTGVLGSQIAFQAAFQDCGVTACDIGDEIIEREKERLAKLAEIYKSDRVPGAAEGKAEEALKNLRLSSDLGDAVSDVDLVIEAVPENLEIKRDTYTKLVGFAPKKTIFATNSSTLLPSDIKDFTGRPDRFIALHYAINVWRQNTAEIMGTSDTAPDVFAAVVEFAKGSGLVPIELKKEKAGYVLNSLLVPLLNAAAGLLVGMYAAVETVDKTWRIATGA
ncbi:MAG: 3-hydroxyacyl-CoA dehydrogenase, partial [Salinibacterium sp.]|nr:3-hydroxyacyl-CoA dehydrogenase [Salinibacterium sp.]